MTLPTLYIWKFGFYLAGYASEKYHIQVEAPDIYEAVKAFPALVPDWMHENGWQRCQAAEVVSVKLLCEIFKNPHATDKVGRGSGK